MSDSDPDAEVEVYSTLLKETLNDVNAELLETEKLLQSLKATLKLQAAEVPNTENEDLHQVLQQTERIEDALSDIAAEVVSDFQRPSKPDIDEPDKDGMNQFERVFKTYVPQIDVVLANAEAILGKINEAKTNEVLEGSGDSASGADTKQQTKNMVASVKRLHNNVIAIEGAFVEEEAPVAEPTIELLYSPPPWSTPPMMPFYFEVREGEAVVEKIPISTKGHYLIGRLPMCDILVDGMRVEIRDATCSRQHAVVQFRPGDPDPRTGNRQDEAYIYDLGSTSGTYVNGMPLQAKAYYPLYRGDILQFGQYAYAFVLRDGSEPGLEPPAGSAKGHEEEAAAVAEAQTTAQALAAGNGGDKKEATKEKIENRDHTADLTDPSSPDFDKDAYKNMMIQAYEKQQRENEEILRKIREREKQGLPPEVIVPDVPQRQRRATESTPAKQGKKGKDCVIS